MAISLDTAVTLTGVSTSATLTQAYTCSGSNRFLVGFFYGNGTSDLLTGGSVTYAGANMTQVIAQSNTSNGLRWIYAYYLLGPASGLNNLVMTATSAPDFMGGDLISYDGVLQYNSSGQVSSSVAVTSISISKSSSNDQAWVAAWAIGSFTGQHSILSSATPLAGATRSTTTGNPVSVDSNGFLTPSGTNETFTFAESGGGASGWGAMAIAFDPIVAGTANPVLGRVGVG